VIWQTYSAKLIQIFSLSQEITADGSKSVLQIFIPILPCSTILANGVVSVSAAGSVQLAERIRRHVAVAVAPAGEDGVVANRGRVLARRHRLHGAEDAVVWRPPSGYPGNHWA